MTAGAADASRARILVVDDEPQVLVALEDLLSDEFVVMTSESPERALNLVKEERDLAVVVTDQRMPRMTGDEFLSKLDGRTSASRIMVTGFADISAVARAINEGRIFAYVSKPWEPRDLKLKIQRAAEHFRLAQELSYERGLLRDLMDNSPDGIYFKDAELRFLRANKPMLERLDASALDILGKRAAELAARTGLADSAESEEREVIAKGIPILDGVRSERRGGAVRWFSESKAPVRDSSGSIVGLVGISREVTLRKEQEARIARLTSVQNLISRINAATARATERDALLRECCRIAGTGGELALALVVRFHPQTETVTFVAVEPDEAPMVRELRELLASGPHANNFVRGVLASKEHTVIADIRASQHLAYQELMLRHGFASVAVMPLRSGGEIDSLFFLFSSTAGFFDAEETKLLVEVADNISFALDHIGKTDRLNFLAYHDSLTGLPNRELFLERVTQQLALRGKDGARLAVLVLDVGRFRQVNETLGRQAGDALLVGIAERLTHLVQGTATLSRLFGDTFALLLPTIESEATVGLLVESQIAQALSAPFLIAGREILASARVGVAVFPSDGAVAETLVANAEAALKKAKTTGRSCVFYAAAMNARVAEKMALETKLRRAIEREEFLLYYQPKIQLKTGLTAGLEALIRWRDPDVGLVPPGSFIPLLEETGLILEVGYWVLERAARQYLEWTRAGLKPPRIAVNVSALQLAASDFVARVQRGLEAYPSAEVGIDLEITESVFVDDMEGSISKLEAARSLGLRVAIDDFGTGYSSLSSIGRLPLDFLKVDRSFVLGMAEDPQITSIVTTIISLGHALDLTVVAEGVETAEQARLLRLLKCDQAQGYLIAKPMPAEDVPAALSRTFELSGQTRS